MMKRLLLLVSTLLAAAVLTCRAAPAAPEPAVTLCADAGGNAAARLAMHAINGKHRHGYKFKLDKIGRSRVEQVKGGCNVELTLALQEADCHVVNPKHFDDCNVREMSDTMVAAACNVSVTVKGGVTNVTKYSCDTRPATTNEELVKICPDCPTLLPLSDAEGLKSVRKAVALVNQNTTNPRYFILMEVGRMSSGYMMMTGMNIWAEFALVESHCPMGTRIVIEACVPLCRDRARHAFCQSSYARTSGELSVDCEFYPAENTTAVDIEPKCGRPHRRPPPMARPGPPPFDTEQRPGPPPHAGVRPLSPYAAHHQHPPHAGGPPHYPYPLPGAQGFNQSPYAAGFGPHRPHPYIHPIGSSDE